MVKIKTLKSKTKICSACKKRKKLTEFYKNKNSKDRSQSRCKKCMNLIFKGYRKLEKWRKKRKVSMKKYYSISENRVRRNKISKKNREKIKQEVMNAYGSKCACCGEPTLEFLTIDHINGGGKAHRLKLGVWGNPRKFYQYLKNHNYPKNLELRVLCMNCNLATSYGRICPHKRKI